LQRPIKRILLVRTDRLGDVILTLPMLSHLRRTVPDAFLSMLLRHYTGEIVEGNPYADQLLWYDERGRTVPFWSMRRMLSEQQFDAVVVVHPTFRLTLLVWLSGIPLRIGTGYRFYALFFNRRVYEHRKDAKRHELEYNLNLLQALGFPPPARVEEPDFGIVIPQEAESELESLLPRGVRGADPLVVVHPASGGSAREWPPERFAGLASALIERNRATILVTGAKGEEDLADEIVRRTGGRAVSLAGKLTLKQLGALLRQASLFVSNSTGPLHLAVAVGTPVLGFYPQIIAMSARRWGPYTGKRRVLVPDRPVDCSDCTGKRGDGCACMESILLEDACAAARELLAEGRKNHRTMAEHA
jgi:heptosyltransferase-2